MPQLSRSSTDTLPPIREDGAASLSSVPSYPSGEEPAQWDAFTLVFVALPAIAGLFFENGSAVMTDLLLLGLGCLFLYWSVKWPWQWYRASQARVFINMSDMYDEEEDMGGEDGDVAVTEDEGDEEPERGAGGSDHDPSPPSAAAALRNNVNTDGAGDETKPAPNGEQSSTNSKPQQSAAASLRRLELVALASCFLSPMLVAYILHAIRPYLSRPSGGLVSNSNLTLFVLSAEIRPLLHLFKLIEARTLHLQHLVTTTLNPNTPFTSPPTSNPHYPPTTLQDLQLRLSDLESTLHTRSKSNGKQPTSSPSPPPSPSPSPSPSPALLAAQATAQVQTTLQPQLDALTRAVRRYEKRATMQALMVESRLRDMDQRTSDALALAAAASRLAGSRRRGVVEWGVLLVERVLGVLVALVVGVGRVPIDGVVWVARFGGRVLGGGVGGAKKVGGVEGNGSSGNVGPGKGRGRKKES